MKWLSLQKGLHFAIEIRVYGFVLLLEVKWHYIPIDIRDTNVGLESYSLAYVQPWNYAWCINELWIEKTVGLWDLFMYV